MRQGAGVGNSYPASGSADWRLLKPRAPCHGSLPCLHLLRVENTGRPPEKGWALQSQHILLFPLHPWFLGQTKEKGAGSGTPLRCQLTQSLQACKVAAGYNDTTSLFQLGQEELGDLEKVYFWVMIVCKCLHNNRVPSGTSSACVQRHYPQDREQKTRIKMSAQSDQDTEKLSTAALWR